MRMSGTGMMRNARGTTIDTIDDTVISICRSFCSQLLLDFSLYLSFAHSCAKAKQVYRLERIKVIVDWSILLVEWRY